MPRAAGAGGALGLRVLQLERGEAECPRVAHVKNVLRHLEDGAVRQKRAMVADGETLEDLVHIDRAATIVERPRVALRLLGEKRGALVLERVEPGKVSIEREERVDDGPRPAQSGRAREVGAGGWCGRLVGAHARMRNSISAGRNVPECA
eukprot:1080643-Prymnesium_polylepis.1